MQKVFLWHGLIVMSFDTWTMCIMTLFPSYLIKSVRNPINLVNKREFCGIIRISVIWCRHSVKFQFLVKQHFHKIPTYPQISYFDEMLSSQPLLWKTTPNTINLFMEWMFALIWISFIINSPKLATALIPHWKWFKDNSNRASKTYSFLWLK